MNWSVVGSLGEAVGAIGVIGSLVYLALQVRAGSKGLFTTMRDSAFNSLKEWNYYVMSDPDLAWIFQQGCKDYNSLSQKERARFIHVMFSFYKLFESIFLHFEDKSINEEIWVYNRLIFFAYAAQPGAKHYWSQRKPTFDPRFRKIVDEIYSSELVAGHIITEMELPDLSVDSEKET